MKRLTAAVMAIIMAFALASSAGAKSGAFPDISDTALMRDVAALQMLGAIGGDDYGNFMPDSTLTRAAFCKIAVIVMGRGEEEPAFRNRTIFPDVRAGYWATGYINLAAYGEKKLLQGNSDGTFKPDDPITYAQAVTILMRMLGYTDNDAGMLWPDGYIVLAKEKGLTADMDILEPGASITRAQAARLFCSLLSTRVKGGGTYISTLGTATANVVMMALDVSAPDGTGGALRTSEGVIKPVNSVFPPALMGLRGTLLKNSLGKVLTFLPDRFNQVTVTVKEVGSGSLKDSLGVRYDIPSATRAYTSTETTTYGTAFTNITEGMRVTLFYSADGAFEGIFIGTLKAGAAAVVGAGGSLGAVSALTGGDSNYSIMRNGVPASMSDILPYDVVTYDGSLKCLSVSDFRLHGCYESCWPNMGNPSKVTMLGHEFTVLPSAVPSLAGCKVGEIVTLLFTADLQVAGAVTGGITGSTAIGIVQSGITATSASVKLLNGLVLSGNPRLGAEAASKLAGELVSVYSSEPGHLGLNPLIASGNSVSLSVTGKTLGGLSVSPFVKLFERVGSGPVAQITFKDIVQTSIGAEKILYAGTDASGRVNVLVFNDVTGDRYAYGFLREDVKTEGSGLFQVSNKTVSLINSANKTGTTPVITGIAFTNNAPGGLAVSTDGTKAAGVVTLTMGPSVKRTAFYARDGVTYLTIDGVEFPVASNVECYNSQGKSWFASLGDARSFAETLTVCYDRPAASGGKIRLVTTG